MNNWERVRLGEVVSHRKKFIQIDDTKTYKRCKVQANMKGVVERDEVSGYEIKTKSQQVCHENDFIVAEIDAKVGGYGFVPSELEGAVVSSHYFLYEIDSQKILKEYLDFFSKTDQFFKQVKAQGSTNYAAIRPHNVLGYEIPLPPLAEQARIVARLESLQRRVAEVRSLREEQARLMAGLKNSVFVELANEFEGRAIGDFLLPERESVVIDPNQDYQQITVRTNHKGVELRGVVKGSEIGSQQFLVAENQFIISKIDARNGAMGLIPKSLTGGVVTNDFPVFSFADSMDFEYFNFFSQTPLFDEACRNASEGTTNRKRLKMDRFYRIQIPLPSLQKQREISAYLKKIEAFHQASAESEALLAGLLPGVLAGVLAGVFGEES